MPDNSGQRLRLADLLAEAEFRLELLSGGPEAAAREVRGAHAVEVDAPARWLGRDWIMLTTGVRLSRDPDAQRALVAQLDAGGASALGFGLGFGFEQVPAAIVEMAEEHGFPVFAVPYETAFRDIIHFVDNAVTGGEEHVFRRLTALQRYLVDALRTPQPERTMVERLARFLDASVVVMNEDSEPEIVAGKLPPSELLQKVGAASPGLLELEAGGWCAVATPVVGDVEQPTRWLVLASPHRGFVKRITKPAVEAAAPLLVATARLTDVVRDQEEAVKAALLAEALEPVEARDVLPLAARAAAFGLDFSAPARLVVIRRHPRRADGQPPPELAVVRRLFVAELDQARVPHLAHARVDSIMALVQAADDAMRPALVAVLDAFPDVVVGIGREVSAIAEAHHSLHDAELAADRGGLGPGRRIVRFEDFDLGTFVVSEIAPERLGPKVDEILSVLHSNPPMYQALSAYFAHDLDIAATADALHMHRNSLRYRLARAEHLLGRSLKQPSTIAAVYIALVAEAGDGGHASKAAR